MRIVSKFPVLDYIFIFSIAVLNFFIFSKFLLSDGYTMTSLLFFPYFVNPFDLMSRIYLSSWNYNLYGTPNFFSLLNFPYSFILYIISAIIGGAVLSRFLMFILVVTLGLTFYVYLRKSLNINPLGSWIASLYLVYNPFFFDYLIKDSNGGDPMIFSLIMGIVSLYALSTYFSQPRSSVIYLFVATLAISSGFSHPVFGVLNVVSFVVAVIFFLIRESWIKGRKIFSKLILVLVSSFCAFAYGLPLLLWYNVDKYIIYNYASLVPFVEGNSLLTKPPFAFLGLTTTLAQREFGLLFVYINTLTILVAILSLLICGKKFKFISAYFSTLYLIMLIWATGSNSPTGPFYLSIANSSVIVSYLLRDPLLALLYMQLPVSILLGISVHSFLSISNKRSGARDEKYKASLRYRSSFTIIKKIISFTIVSLLVVNSFVLINSSIFAISPPNRIPNYYNEVSSFLAEEYTNNTFRLFFPQATASVFYSWTNNPRETPLLGIIFPSIIPYAIQGLGLQGGDVYTLNKIIYENLSSPANPEILGLFNVKYIVLQNDIAYTPWYSEPPGLNNFLNSTNLHVVQTFGNITLFSNDRFRPVFYIPRYIVLYNSVESFVYAAKIIAETNFSTSLAYINESYFKEQGLANFFREATKIGNITVYEMIQFVQPNINIIRYNYDNYRIIIKNVPRYFLLISGDSYDPLWQVRISDGDVRFNVTHFKANLFVNAWLINSNSSLLDILIEFSGRYYTIASIFIYSSYAILVLSLLVLTVLDNKFVISRRVRKLLQTYRLKIRCMKLKVVCY